MTASTILARVRARSTPRNPTPMNTRPASSTPPRPGSATLGPALAVAVAIAVTLTFPATASLQTALTPADTLVTGLMAHWKLDDGQANPAATVATDDLGANPGTLTAPDPAGAWLGPADAKLGGALKVDGETTFVTIPASESLDPATNQVSLALWVKLDQLPSELPAGFGGLFDSAQDSYVLYLDRGAAELRFKITDAAGHAARPGIPEDRLVSGAWLHVAAVYDGHATPEAGEARLYLNGELIDTHLGNDGAGGTGLTGIVRAGQIAGLGRDGAEARYFAGSTLDDVALWKRALTAEEIAYLAAGGMVPTPPPPVDPILFTLQPRSITVLEGSLATFRVTVSGGIPPIQYQWRRDGADLAGATQAQFSVVAATATAGTYTVIARDSRGPVTSQPATLEVTPLAALPADSLRQGLVALWPLDDGQTTPDTTNAVDVASGNTGFLGAPQPRDAWVSGADARFDGALRLDGAESFVAIPVSDSLNFVSDQVTVAAWVKLDSLPSELPDGFGGIFDSVQDNYVLYCDRGNRELRFKVTDARGHAARPGIPEDQLLPGEWIHVAGVYNARATATAGEAAVYLNGRQADAHLGNDGAGGSGLTGLVRTGQAAALGRNGTESRYFLGARVDDVAVWNRALSAAELAYLASGQAVPKPLPALPIQLATPVVHDAQVTLTWSGGRPPFRVQRRASLEAGAWQNVGTPTEASSATVATDGATGFFRVTSDVGASK
jgi:hypothetical protein